MRRALAVLISVSSVLASVVLTAPTASAAPYCGIRWGSLPESAPTVSTGLFVDIRAGQHPCFDRLVLDVQGDVSGYSVQYVDQVHHDETGQLVPLRGGARLEVTAMVPANPGDYLFIGEGADVIDARSYRTFEQVAWAGGTPGSSSIGVGVRGRLPFRVFVLDGPGELSRLVVDVAHRW